MFPCKVDKFYLLRFKRCDSLLRDPVSSYRGILLPSLPLFLFFNVFVSVRNSPTDTSGTSDGNNSTTKVSVYTFSLNVLTCETHTRVYVTRINMKLFLL